MKQLITNIYPISELTDKQIKLAYERWNETNEFYDEFIIDDITEIAKTIGIHIDKIHYSGFYNQGDGAMFEGKYEFNPNWKTDLEEYAPNELVVKQLGESLVSIYNTHPMTAIVKHNNSHYYHSNTAEIIVLSVDEDEIDTYESRNLKMYLRCFMNWMYRHLLKEYDDQMSLENFKEYAIDNDYHFDEHGFIRG